MRIVSRAAAALAVTGAIVAVGVATTEAAQAAPATTRPAPTNVAHPATWIPTVVYKTYDECVTAGIAGKNAGEWSAYSCDWDPGTDWQWALEVFVE
jgi:hypothetical protein